MTKPEAPVPKDGGLRPKRKPFKKSKAELADPEMYEAVLKERRHQVRTIPVPDVVESNSDSDWAAFNKA